LTVNGASEHPWPVKIAFNSANLVGRVTGYRFEMAGWMDQHKQTVKTTDAAEFAKICAEIAASGFTDVELWQALADPSVMTQETAKEWRAIAEDHGLRLIGYGGYIGTGAEKVSRWLGIDTINGMFGLSPDDATKLCRDNGVRCNYENHPQKTVAEILEPIGGGNEWLGVCVDLGWLGTQGVDASAVLRELGPLVRHVHAKDVLEVGRHRTCKLGDGIVGMSECIRTLADIGYDGWLSWEDEPTDRNPMDTAVENRVWLEAELAKL
jgi:sugar phosphate isomerase/epimerase